MKTKQFSILVFLCFTCLISCKKSSNTCSREYPDGVWLHRANEIAKAQYFQCKYEGLEIDVHFDDSLKTFIIKHDFGNNAKDDRNPGYPIEMWCDSLSRISEINLWFDFKNLSQSNKIDALKCLQNLRKKYSMNGKIYVESNAHECLSIFQDSGFNTSYYIPYYELPIDSVSENRVISEIANAVEHSNLVTISGYDYQYPLMKTNFPTLRKLLWVDNDDMKRQEAALHILETDSLVDVLLLPNNSYK